jgi:hypothetical protein
MIGAVFFLIGAVLALVAGWPWWVVALFVLGIAAGLWVEEHA